MKPLNPIMAALLAASSAAFALPGTAHANEAAGNCLEKIKDETDPRNAMTCLVANEPGANKDIGARFAEFVQGKDSKGRSYLTDDLRKSKTLMPAVVKEAQDWPEKNKATPGWAAILYFVIGPGSSASPAWVQKAPVLAKLDKADQSKSKLRERLEIFLADAKWTGDRRISLSKTDRAVDNFLIEASSYAYKVFIDTRTQAEIKISIDGNNTTEPEPPVVGGGARKNPLDSSGAGFGFNDLYGPPGAIVQDVWGTHDDGYRRISMKMYTIKITQADGTEALQNMIGIVDITPGDPNTPYKPTFIPMTQSGESKLTLRDGGRKYTLNIGLTESGEHTVTFGRPDGQALSTSMEKLAIARANQAAAGGIVTIGGQQFYAMPQGGEHGSVLFFPKDQVDNRDSAPDARYLRPVGMGDVSKLDPDGLTVPMDGKPDVGSINGKPYHLEFDYATKMWQVKDGKGDKPKVVDPAKTTGGAPNPVTGSTTTTGGGQTGTTPTDGASTLDQVVDLLKTVGYSEAPGNAGFADDVKSQIRIMKHVKDGVVIYSVLFDPGLGVANNQIDVPGSVGAGPQLQPLKGVRGAGHYIIFEYAQTKEYLSIDNFVKWSRHEDVTPDMLLDPKVGMQNVTSIDMALDMLTHYFGLKKEEKDKLLDEKNGLRARVAAQSKGEGYVISGNGKLVYMAHGEEGMEIWPELIKRGDNGTNQGMTGLRGPGTAVAMTGGGPSEFKKEMEMGGGHVIKLVKAQDHIAIYAGPEDEAQPDGSMKTPNLWYVMLDYKKNGNPSRTKPLPVFGGRDRFALPKSYEMQGLEGLDLPDTAQLMLLHGSTQEKGAIAAYRYVLPDSQGGQNARDKEGNCGGPVIWWGGETKDQAQKACEGDSKIH